MRVHLLQNHMTFEQADTLLYYLSSQKLVTGVKVREKTQDATINFVRPGRSNPGTESFPL